MLLRTIFDEYDDYDKFEDEGSGRSVRRFRAAERSAGGSGRRGFRDVSYVSLDLKKAKEKADDFISTVSGKVEKHRQ